MIFIPNFRNRRTIPPHNVGRKGYQHNPPNEPPENNGSNFAMQVVTHGLLGVTVNKAVGGFSTNSDYDPRWNPNY